MALAGKAKYMVYMRASASGSCGDAGGQQLEQASSQLQ